MTGILELQSLSVLRLDRPIVALSVVIRPGEVLSIMGPSGSGKSTALAAILGTLPPGFHCRGRVILSGRDILALPTHKRRVGMLFQDDILFPHLSVGDNLSFAIPPEVKGRDIRAELVETALAQAGLAGMARRDPMTLSGGQRARVALMRALLAKPDALLLDEPFSKLDDELRTQIREFVLSTLRERQIPAILVTHDKGDALAAGGAILSPLGQPVVP